MLIARLVLLSIVSTVLATMAAAEPAELGQLPENIARRATITASSEQQGSLPVTGVADGRISPASAAFGEVGSWAVVGDEAKGKAEITFAWDKPTDLAEVVYFGRCAWQMEEVFKDYEVFAEGHDKPIAKGSLEMVAGPQRIRLKKVTSDRLTIKFLSSHGGSNPGAAEIMVFPASPSDDELDRVIRFVPNSLFNDHVVLQRGQPLRVWGTAADGERVYVEFRDQKQSTVATNGRWQVELPAAETGDPAELRITSAVGAFTVSDVLIGEVWIASGQSNMEMPVDVQYWPNRYDGVANAEQEITSGDHPQIRMFYVPRVAAGVPKADSGGQWRVCSPQTVGGFSAAAYFFGRKLHEELDVPIGLVDCSWGATYIEPWTPREVFDTVPELADVVQAANEQKAAYDQFVRDNQGAIPPSHQHQVSALYNGMVHRLTPFPIRGAIWYQGEGNVGNGMAYAYKMQALIEGWRGAWGQGQFPFLFVQLAPYDYGKYKGSKNPYQLPALWEAQASALRIPNTGMAVTTDISDVDNIHPPNKQDVGLRLALQALALTYGQENVVCNGPRFRYYTIEGEHIRLHFDHLDGGLVSRDGQPLNWFTIAAAADQKFHEGVATIDGDTIVVQCPDVSEPSAVRFGWHKLAEPNLSNKAGLPASPFRTDDWPVQIGNEP